MQPPTGNLLSRGLLAPSVEARLVARGIVYAESVARANGRGWRTIFEKLTKARNGDYE